MTQKIAIQGIKGSFHDQVVKDYFSNAPELLECLSFDALAQAVAAGACCKGVMAIENSIAGSILPNYALMDQYELVISGEHYLSIEHNLMSLPGQKIEEIEEEIIKQQKKIEEDYRKSQEEEKKKKEEEKRKKEEEKKRNVIETNRRLAYIKNNEGKIKRNVVKGWEEQDKDPERNKLLEQQARALNTFNKRPPSHQQKEDRKVLEEVFGRL